MARRPTPHDVTADTEVTHRSGDNSVDSVDNSGSALPHGGPVSARGGKRSPERNSAAGVENAGGPADSTSSGAGQPQGRDLARAALAAAKERAAARGAEPGVRRPGSTKSGVRALPGQNPRRRRWSGPGADERDPQPFGRLVSRMSTQLGWTDRLANGRVFGQWSALVGAEVAEHAQPVSLNNGELTVRASSTAWATQLRLLQRQLLARIAAGVGHGVVTTMRIQGPTAPSWRKGPRHIPGRGPRDTYG